jgi:hypothetical protein
MKTETIDTITRHLKGIVAALEKEKNKSIFTCYGKALDLCSDEELIEAYKSCLMHNYEPMPPREFYEEIVKRKINLHDINFVGGEEFDEKNLTEILDQLPDTHGRRPYIIDARRKG